MSRSALGCAFVFKRRAGGLPAALPAVLLISAPVSARAAPAWLTTVLDAPLRFATAGAAADTSIIVGLAGLNLILAGWIVVFLAAGFLTRWARVRERARRDRFAARWEPLLHGRMAGDREPLPALARGDEVRFLLLWLHLAGYVRDEGEEGLRSAGAELGVERRVLALLGSTTAAPWQLLLAIRAAALLGITGASIESALARLAANAAPKLALAAAEALLKIAPAEGRQSFRALVLRGGWSPAAMAAAATANPDATRRALEQALAAIPAGQATPVIRLLELIESLHAVPALRLRLANNRDNAETGALLHALGRLGSAEDRDTALGLIADKRWVVRMHAAYALGMLGLPPDLDVLGRLLSDPEWWVRYRAAQAILRLARGDQAVLDAVLAKIEDRFARDAMAFAVAEFAWQPAT